MTRSNSELEKIEEAENAFEELRALAMEDSQYDAPSPDPSPTPSASAGGVSQEQLAMLLAAVKKKMGSVEEPRLGNKPY